jgi:hypothetical protein
MKRLGTLDISLNQIFYDLLCQKRGIRNQREPAWLLCICHLALTYAEQERRNQ